MKTKWRKRRSAKRVEFAGRVITAFLDEFAFASFTADAHLVQEFLRREFG